jgi:quinol monooxygenase YgiN
MITMTFAVKVSPEKQKEFLQAVYSLDTRRKNEKGLRGSVLKQERDDQTSFTLRYTWETREEMDRYVKGNQYRLLLGALQVLGEKTEIRFDHEKITRLSNSATGSTSL